MVNISLTSSKDPAKVRHELMRVFAEQQITCMPHGYVQHLLLYVKTRIGFQQLCSCFEVVLISCCFYKQAYINWLIFWWTYFEVIILICTFADHFSWNNTSVHCFYSWKLAGHKVDPNHGTMTVELELVWVEMGNKEAFVGVRRRRLDGDAFLYKTVCEEVLQMASLWFDILFCQLFSYFLNMFIC